MKTGGTMNFLKKAGAILMIVAVFASSCNKYADDFKQLNTKLDALATQVAGVTTLSTDMTALKASVATLQTAIAALPKTADITALATSLAGITTKVDALTTTLKTVADNGTATKAVVDGLKTSLADLLKKTTDDDAALTLAIAGLATTDLAQNTALSALKDQNTALATAVADVYAKLNDVAQTGAAGTDATALTIKGLQLMLDAQKLQLEQILKNTAMYNGDVTVTNAAEITFYLAKLAQLGIVNGSVYINTTALTAAQMVDVNKITSAITAVIGTVADVTIVNTAAAGTIDFSKLVSVKGNYKVAGNLAGTVAGLDVNDVALSSVGGVAGAGNVTLCYDGAYESTALTTVTGNLTLVDQGAAPVAPAVGTTSINFPNVKVTGGVFDGVGGAGVLTFPIATNITLSGGVSSLTAAKAVSIKLGATTYATGLTIVAGAATVVDLSTCTGAAAAVAITTKAAGVVDLSAFKTANVPVTITGPTALSFPVWTGGALAVLTSTTATDVTLAKHSWAAPAVLAAVKNLTLGAVNAPVNLSSFATLVTANVTGATQTKWASVAATVSATVNPVLTTVTFGGVLGSVTLKATVPATDLIKLTSVTTSGQINSFEVTDADALATLSLAHMQFVGDLGFGATGSDLTVKNNNVLTSVVTTALDKLNTLTVTGNAKLAAFDFSSYKLLKDDASAIFVDISGNNGTAFTTASFTPCYLVTGSTPYQEAIIKSNSILTLKAYFALAAAHVPAVGLVAGTNIDINLKTPAALPADLLSALMIANKTALGAGALVVNAVGGINTYGEMALVVAE